MASKGSGEKRDDVFDEMHSLYTKGFSMDAIARALPGNGCAETIRKEFARRGISRRRSGPVSNPINDVEMLRLYETGSSLGDLAKRYGVSLVTIRNHLMKHGKQRRSRGSSRESKHGKWKGGLHVKKSGHVLRKAASHPHRNRLGYVPEHRLIIEKELGGFLLPFEVVHHKDHVPANNELANLRLFCGRDEHDLYGHPERLWGITRSKAALMLQRIRELRKKRRAMLTPSERAARRRLFRPDAHYEIRARMVVAGKTRYVQLPSATAGRRQEHEHRRTMEGILGRAVASHERVHHEDGDKGNNAHENLFLFASNGDHINYHNWKGILHFRGPVMAERFLAAKCTGMRNSWPSAMKGAEPPEPGH